MSSLPTLARGERAVFFLTPGKQGEFRPHLRGQGILKLDRDDRVRGSSLTLDEIRTERTGDVDADVQRLTEDFTARLEAAIRENPEQYLWHHRRWKTRPPEETDSSSA